MQEILGRYAEVRGHRVFYESVGSGTPVVCIHTSGQSAMQWRFVLPLLAQNGYHAVALDLPGHGKSLAAGFRPVNSLHEYAEVIWDLCAQIGLDRPVFFGCSIGADICLDLGINHPEHIRALVVCDGAAHTPTSPPGAIALMLEDSGCPGAGDLAFYGSYGACGSKAPPERALEIAWTARSRDPKVHANDLIGWNTHDVRARLGAITCPVLLVRGEEDFLVPRALMEDTQNRLSQAEFVELPGIGHFPHIESVELPDIVLQFLRKHRI